MINEIRILLGSTVVNVPLTDNDIHTAIGLASERYKRFRPAVADWGANPRAHSWIMEYALAYCSLMLGQAQARMSGAGPTDGATMIGVAMNAITTLNQELTAYA